jgi:hypothetical protein
MALGSDLAVLVFLALSFVALPIAAAANYRAKPWEFIDPQTRLVGIEDGRRGGRRRHARRSERRSG